MNEDNMRELEQAILEALSDEPQRLMEIYHKGIKVNFAVFFQAIANLLRDKYVSYHEIEGKPAYRRTGSGFERMQSHRK